MKPLSKFWMCLAEKGVRPPSVRHQSQSGARGEARRLAADLQCRVWVLSADSAFEPCNVIEREVEFDDGIPF